MKLNLVEIRGWGVKSSTNHHSYNIKVLDASFSELTAKTMSKDSFSGMELERGKGPFRLCLYQGSQCIRNQRESASSHIQAALQHMTRDFWWMPLLPMCPAKEHSHDSFFLFTLCFPSFQIVQKFYTSCNRVLEPQQRTAVAYIQNRENADDLG